MKDAKEQTQFQNGAETVGAQNSPVHRYVQNADKNTISGANVPIMQVGMHNFKLPLKFLTKDCGIREAEASVTATVSLAADSKGINMSRIMRVFYLFADRVFTPDLLEEILVKMKEQLKTSRARIKIDFNYPILQTSLRSNLKAWQYYWIFLGNLE